MMNLKLSTAHMFQMVGGKAPIELFHHFQWPKVHGSDCFFTPRSGVMIYIDVFFAHRCVETYLYLNLNQIDNPYTYTLPPTIMVQWKMAGHLKGNDSI